MRLKILIDSWFPRISLLTTCVAFFFFIIGFFSQYWLDGPLKIPTFPLFTFIGHVGLWRGCDVTDTLCFTPEGPSWFEATQAFETLGFIAALAALVLIVLYIFVPQTSGKKIICILSMLACFAAAACIMLGIIIYGSKVERNLSWSFALCCIAGIIFGVSGVLLLIDMLKK